MTADQASNVESDKQIVLTASVCLLCFVSHCACSYHLHCVRIIMFAII